MLPHVVRQIVAHVVPALKAGAERWPVKTGADPQAASIPLVPIDTTIQQMRLFRPPPHPDRLTSRDAPIELHIFRLTATLAQAHLEADGDYHLVLADDLGLTMIAEIPDPSLVSATSPWLGQIVAARESFDSSFGELDTRRGEWAKPNAMVVVTGVGMFDALHGQTGVASNGIELHPVLSITKA